MRKQLESMALDEMRQLREVLAECVEDLDLALVGKLPDDLDDEHLMMHYQLFRAMNASGIWLRLMMLTAGAGLLMNEKGMVDRAQRVQGL